MNVLRITALALALVQGTVLQARDLMPDRVRVPLATEHVNGDVKGTLNEINPGLALTWDAAWADVTVGVVRNSFSDSAPFATLSRDLWRGDICGVAAFLGTAHYRAVKGRTPYDVNGWIPIGGLHLECGPGFVQVMPGSGVMDAGAGKGRSDTILVFGLTFDLDR
jgi:hypothetical protein